MISLTEQEQKIFDALSAFIEERGYPPSQRELARKVGLKSPNTVDYHLKKLELKGLVRCPKNRFRAVEIVSDETNASSESNTVRIPILGTVPAGPPNLALEQHEDTIEVDRSLARGKVFGLYVKGDSMKDAGVIEGDMVVVRWQPAAQEGDMVVARFEDEATVKYLRRFKGEFYFVPANEKYQPFPAKDAAIVGKVIAVIRKVH